MVTCYVCERDFDSEDCKEIIVDEDTRITDYICEACRENAKDIQAAHKRGMSYHAYIYGDRFPR